MNQDKYRTLLTASIPQLYTLALRLTHSKTEAGDLLQDTLLLLLEKHRSYTDKNFIGWSYTHLHNQFLNTLRKNKPLLYDTAPRTDTAGYTTQTCAEFDIRQAIRQLPPAQRTVMQLYLEGYRYDEIADIRHIPEGTVKSRISRARKKLQDILQAYR